jgi:phosphohistidine phosphatase
MKRIYLVRHAKSVIDPFYLTDKDRPLSDKGNKDAYKMAMYCRANFDDPDLFICSDAARTRQTMGHFINFFYDACMELSPDLYLAHAETIKAKITSLPDKLSCVYIIGHNPGMEDLVDELVPDAGKFSTGAIAVFDSDTNKWQNFFSKTPSIIEFITPKII